MPYCKCTGRANVFSRARSEVKSSITSPLPGKLRASASLRSPNHYVATIYLNIAESQEFSR